MPELDVRNGAPLSIDTIRYSDVAVIIFNQTTNQLRLIVSGSPPVDFCVNSVDGIDTMIKALQFCKRLF